jgi:hypothetical protein
MRTSTIKEILLHLAEISFLAGLQAAWLFCAADFIFSYGLGDKISVWSIIPVYFAAAVLNVLVIHTLRLIIWRIIINSLAIAFIFYFLPPFNLSVRFMISEQAGGFSGILLGLVIIAITAVYWYQGFRLAAARISFPHSLGEFQFGFLIFLIIFFSQAVSGADRNYFAPTVIFFVCGMISLFLSRREGSAALSGFSIMINTAAFVCIILTVACGLILAIIFNPGLADKLYWAGKNVLLFIFNLIWQIFYFLAGLLPKPETALLPVAPPVQKPPDPSEMANIFRIPPIVRQCLQVIVVGVFSAMVIAALWSISRQIVESFLHRKGGIRGEVRSLKGNYLQSFLALIKNAARAFLKRLQWLYIRIQGRNNDVLTMKFIYGQILRWAAMDGYKQRIAQTPHELCPELAFWLPEASSELSFITQQFVKVRYGEEKLSKDIMHEAWEKYKTIKQRKKRLFFQRRRK